MAITCYLKVMGILSVVWPPRKYETSAGKRKPSPPVQTNSSLQDPTKTPPRLRISQDKNLQRTLPQGQQGPRRPQRQTSKRGSSNQRNSVKRRQEMDRQTNTDIKGCRILAAGNLKRTIPPHTKGKSNKDRGGPQPPRRSNRGTIGATKGAAGTIICRNFCPPTQVNLNTKEGARKL